MATSAMKLLLIRCQKCGTESWTQEKPRRGWRCSCGSKEGWVVSLARRALRNLRIGGGQERVL